MFDINIGFRLDKDLFDSIETTKKLLYEKHHLKFNRNEFIRTLLEYGLIELRKKFAL